MAAVPGEAATATVAVIVPATNRPPTLTECLEAIRNGPQPPEELIVVTEPEGAGPAAARNAGAARATASLLVFVDADVVAHADALSRIRARFEGDPSLTALFGSYDDSPRGPGTVSVFRNLLHHHVHQQAAGQAETFWAGLGAIRREAFLDVGGFDEDRFVRPSVEDVELGMRMVATGARIQLDPAIQGTHLKRWTLLGMLRSDFADRGLPWVALLVRSGTLPRHLNLGWRHRLSMSASLLAVYSLVRRRPIAALGATLVLVGLNRSLYALVLRRLGPVRGATGVGIHALHHMAGAGALVAGLLRAAVRGGGKLAAIPVERARPSRR